MTIKNQLTLPKSIIDAVGKPDYFDVELRSGQIVLTPVRIQRGDAVRGKLAELALTAVDIEKAVAWARSKSPARQSTANPAHKAADPASRYKVTVAKKKTSAKKR